MSQMTVGRVAKEAAVGVETLRFYEREGLLDPPARKESSGYRQYSADIIPRLRFIKRAKELGFSLPAIRDLLRLRMDEATACGDVRARAEVAIGDLERRIADLSKMKAALQEIVATCAVSEPTGPCPLLEILTRNEKGLFAEERSRT